MLASNIEQGKRNGSAIDDFFFESHARLLYPRSYEVRGECGNVVGHSLREAFGERTIRGIERTIYKGIGIRGKGLVVVVVRTVKKNLRVRDSVLSLDH